MRCLTVREYVINAEGLKDALLREEGILTSGQYTMVQFEVNIIPLILIKMISRLKNLTSCSICLKDVLLTFKCTCITSPVPSKWLI